MQAHDVSNTIDLLVTVHGELNRDVKSKFAAYLLSLAILELCALIGADYSDNDNKQA